MMKRYLLLLLLLLLGGPLVFSRDSLRLDPYNLDFRIFYTQRGSGWTWHYPTCCTLRDTSSRLNGKVPVKFVPLTFRGLFDMHERMKYRKDQEFPFQFYISQAIYLPSAPPESEVKVSVTTKSCNARNVWLRVAGFDRNEHMLYADSVDVTSPDGWTTRSLCFVNGNTKYLRIGLQGEEIPGTDHSGKGVWVDRIGITLGGRDLYDYPVDCDTCRDNGARLSSSEILPLAGGDVSAFASVPAFSDPAKRIIALGECMHGNATIDSLHFAVLRSLIVNNNCRLLMFEMGVDDCLKWDLYTRGITPDSAIFEISDELKAAYRSSFTEVVSFFQWLRVYNKGCKRKVRLYGIDDPQGPKTAYFGYFVGQAGPRADTSFLSLLKSCYVLDYPGMLRSYRSDKSLRKKLGAEEYGFVLGSLERAYEESRAMYDTLNFYDLKLKYGRTRERSMADRALWLIGHRLGKGEKAALVMHSGHVNKQDNYVCFFSYLPERSVGSYLSERFGAAYYAVTFQVGGGTYRQSSGPFGGLYTYTLSPPPYNSFEYSALETGLDCFFYPVSGLPEGLSYCRLLPVGNNGDLEFVFQNLRDRYDGIVFIRDSRAATNGIVNSMDTAIKLYYKWSDKRKEFIDKLEERLKER